MKKLITTLMLAAVVVATPLAFSSASDAAGKSAPKATGGVGYTAYTSTQRHADFSAIETDTTCLSSWDVSGNYVIAFNLTGDPTIYAHDAVLTQTNTNITGVGGGYPAGGAHIFEWVIDSGTVTGTTVNLTAHYTADASAIGTIMHMTGTIASNGTMSGTWDDDYLSGARNGDWVSTSGAATKVNSGCTGKGEFNYSDADGYFYHVNVQYVNVDGNQTWFAGPVVSGNVGAGQWLFAKVKDLGTPGSNGDQIWGSFTTQSAAINGVATMSTPGDGPFDITSGNLVVH